MHNVLIYIFLRLGILFSDLTLSFVDENILSKMFSKLQNKKYVALSFFKII